MAEPGPLRQLFRSAWWVVLNLVGLVLVGQWLWEVVQGLQPLLLVAAGAAHLKTLLKNRA